LRTVSNTTSPTALPGTGRALLRDATCPVGGSTAGGSTGRVDPAGNTRKAGKACSARTAFIEFGMKPFGEGENGGIKGHVIYASTRPFDDPQFAAAAQLGAGCAAREGQPV